MIIIEEVVLVVVVVVVVVVMIIPKGDTNLEPNGEEFSGSSTSLVRGLEAQRNSYDQTVLTLRNGATLAVL